MADQLNDELSKQELNENSSIGAGKLTDTTNATSTREAPRTKQRGTAKTAPVPPWNRRRRRYAGRLFALRNNGGKQLAAQSSMPIAVARTYDYEQKYPEDPYGEEAFPEARVWRVYNDEADIFDLERIEAWRDALDVLLVFIGLFSAIVATFLVQTSQALQPDYSQAMVYLSWEILHAIANSSAPNPTPISINAPNPYEATGSPTHNDKVVNILWVTSLAISLSTGLFTVLVKQWLYHYTTSTSGTSRQRSRIRQFRDEGLQRYGVALIIDLLPVALHSALALFMVGLALFFSPLSSVMFWIIVGITGAAYGLYFTSSILPLFDPQCPYYSPITSCFHPFTKYPTAAAVQAIHYLVYLCRKWFEGDTKANLPPTHWPPASSITTAEKRAVQQKSAQLDIDGIVWLYTTSANSTVQSIALEAFGGLGPSFADTRRAHEVLSIALAPAVQQCTTFGLQEPRPGMEWRHDRLIRALCVVDRVAFNDDLLFFKRPLHGDDDPRKVLSDRVLPWLRVNYDDGSLAALFLQSGLTFPPSVWAIITRLVTKHQPEDPVLKVVFIATLSLQINASETGPVLFAVAAQGPVLRSLVMYYLGISEEINTTTVLLRLLTDILSRENAEETEQAARVSLHHSIFPTFTSLLTHLLPSLFTALAVKSWGVRLSRSNRQMMSTLLGDFLDFPFLGQVSWETIDCATLIWAALHPDTIRALTGPSMISRILELFRNRTDYSEEDVIWIERAVNSLCRIFAVCFDARSHNLGAAICNAMERVDMLHADMELQQQTCLRLFWSPAMCVTLVRGTSQLQESSNGTVLLRHWIRYIHTPHRLDFFCRQFIPLSEEPDNTALLDLCLIEPYNAIWPSCFKALLLLFQDSSYLRMLEVVEDSQFDAPRCGLGDRLTEMKDILRAHHPILSHSSYNIPYFDDDDNEVPPGFDYQHSIFGEQLYLPHSARARRVNPPASVVPTGSHVQARRPALPRTHSQAVRPVGPDEHDYPETPPSATRRVRFSTLPPRERTTHKTLELADNTSPPAVAACDTENVISASKTSQAVEPRPLNQVAVQDDHISVEMGERMQDDLAPDDEV